MILINPKPATSVDLKNECIQLVEDIQILQFSYYTAPSVRLECWLNNFTLWLTYEMMFRMKLIGYETLWKSIIMHSGLIALLLTYQSQVMKEKILQTGWVFVWQHSFKAHMENYSSLEREAQYAKGHNKKPTVAFLGTFKPLCSCLHDFSFSHLSVLCSLLWKMSPLLPGETST